MAQQYVEIIAYGLMSDAGSENKNIANVFHFRRASGVGTPNKDNIEAAFQTAIMDKVLLAAASAYTQNNTTVRWLDDATDPPAVYTEAGPGAIATDPLPSFNTVSMQLKTGVKGRSARGAKRFAGLAEAHTTKNVINATGLGLWGTVASNLSNGFTDSDGYSWFPVVNSHQPPAQCLVNPVVLVWNDVISVLLNEVVGVMRRRKSRIS